MLTKKWLEDALARNYVIRIAFETRFAVLPLHLKKPKFCALDFGLNLRKPIPDLELTEEYIAGTLSFGGLTHYCKVPYDAIVGIEEDGAPAQVEQSRPLRKMPAGWRVIDGGKTDGEGERKPA